MPVDTGPNLPLTQPVPLIDCHRPAARTDCWLFRRELPSRGRHRIVRPQAPRYAIEPGRRCWTKIRGCHNWIRKRAKARRSKPRKPAVVIRRYLLMVQPNVVRCPETIWLVAGIGRQTKPRPPTPVDLTMFPNPGASWETLLRRKPSSSISRFKTVCVSPF